MTLAAALAVLLAHNLAAAERWYVAVNLATAGALVAMATAGAGATLDDLGLTLAGAPAGLAVGAAAALTVVLLAALPRTRPLFYDRRMDGVGARGAAYRAAVRIPLGTVVLEEVAFRGVLPALGTPPAAAALLFGLWHIRPAAATLRTNHLPVTATTLAVAVLATTAAGLAFYALRAATGGLLAPALVHAAITATATIAAYRVHHMACRSTG